MLERLSVKYLTGRVRWRIDPDQRRPSISKLIKVVAGDCAAACDLRTNQVGRIGHRRVDHKIIGTEPEQCWQPGHQFLGTDHWQGVIGRKSLSPPTPRQVRRDCLTQS